jgi:zinc/manganese transport system permease protein
MPELLIFMAAPFAACLILVGIHAYLGIHVLAREVIFVDLSLAQIAALGSTLAFLAGFAIDSGTAYLFSLGATFLGAGVFAVTRFRSGRVSQEAIIGIVYAVSAAAGVLAIDRAPHGAEHIKQMLVGSILWVTWPEVVTTGLIYATVGAFHWVFRGRFLTISFDASEAARQGWSIRAWDFLFYASFGFVITSSVKIAGVLLVFSFLIVPAVCATLFAGRIGSRLAIGWTVGFFVSALGCTVSYLADLPTGATVVCMFGAVLVLLALARRALPAA